MTQPALFGEEGLARVEAIAAVWCANRWSDEHWAGSLVLTAARSTQPMTNLHRLLGDWRAERRGYLAAVLAAALDENDARLLALMPEQDLVL